MSYPEVRIYDAANKQMWYKGMNISYWYSKDIIPKEKIDRDFFLITDKEFMLFTGLYDRNGKEIWEGDIVMWGDLKIGKEYPVRIAIVEYPNFAEVVFNAPNVGIKFEYGIFAYSDTERYLKVIGNIYENPELIPTEKEGEQQ